MEHRRGQTGGDGGTEGGHQEAAWVAVQHETGRGCERHGGGRPCHMAEPGLCVAGGPIFRHRQPVELVYLHRLLHERGPAGQEHDAGDMGRPEVVVPVLGRGHHAGRPKRQLPGLRLPDGARHHRPGAEQQVRLRGPQFVAVEPGAGEHAGAAAHGGGELPCGHERHDGA